jgi:hypothetical protein
VQLITDGHRAYLEAVELAFGGNVDYALLQKIYEASDEPEKPYSPVKCIVCDMKTGSGVPDPKHVSTSFIERQNLTLHISMRRFTRLTNAFSKKVENHAAAVALHFIHYNFARIHKSLRSTPAMAAGISDHVWSYKEIADLANYDVALACSRRFSSIDTTVSSPDQSHFIRCFFSRFFGEAFACLFCHAFRIDMKTPLPILFLESWSLSLSLLRFHAPRTRPQFHAETLPFSARSVLAESLARWNN